MAQKFANAARAVLASGIISSDTTVTIVSGGSLFPEIVSPDFARAVLQDGSGIEIVLITAHTASADSFTITRAQEGTTARSFAAGSIFGIRVTAADMDEAMGAGGLTYVTKTANYTTADKEGVLADTSGGAFTVTLPATPATGAQVVVADAGNSWGVNNLTVGRNGSTIGGLAENLVCDINGVSVQFVYDGATWETYAQIGGNGGTAVTLDSTQTLTNKTIAFGSNTLTDVASTNTSQTLTNKTLTSPVITQDIQVINTNTTAVRSRTYVFTATLTLTLPASPTAGDMVMFANRSTTATPVIGRNGQNIMGLAEDMTVNNVNYFATLVFADATRGWIFQ